MSRGSNGRVGESSLNEGLIKELPALDINLTNDGGTI